MVHMFLTAPASTADIALATVIRNWLRNWRKVDRRSVLVRMTESQRGGVRPGAGRKPNPSARMVTTAFVITRQQAAWLDAQAITTGGSKSEIVRRALDALMAGSTA